MSCFLGNCTLEIWKLSLCYHIRVCKPYTHNYIPDIHNVHTSLVIHPSTNACYSPTLHFSVSHTLCLANGCLVSAVKWPSQLIQNKKHSNFFANWRIYFGLGGTMLSMSGFLLVLFGGVFFVCLFCPQLTRVIRFIYSVFSQFDSRGSN